MGSTPETLPQQPISGAQGRALLREEVYARIRGRIIDGDLPPGTRLRDREIAEELGVSRTPVREALRRLEDDGLVVTEASRWTKVAPVDTAAAGRIYPIIWTLERLAVSQGTYEGWRLSAMREANERLRAAVAEQDPVGASVADSDFHRLAVEGAANPELAAILDDLRTDLHRLEVAYFGGAVAAERSVREHEAVIRALDADDLEEASLALEQNWRASFDRLGFDTTDEGPVG